MLLIEAHCKVVRNLSTGGNDYAIRLLHVDDIHNTLECQLIEIETVAHVIVGRNGLRVIVYHHRAVALLADSIESLHATPVELN